MIPIYPQMSFLKHMNKTKLLKIVLDIVLKIIVRCFVSGQKWSKVDF